MKLATFRHAGDIKIGAVCGDEIAVAGGHVTAASDMAGFLAAGAPALDALREFTETGSGRVALADVQILAPIPRPGKFLGIGLNYADHIEETGRDRPEYPTFFSKLSSCVIGPGEPILCPKVSDKVDYEGELAFVIGRRGRHIPLERAREYIAGFTICNDVTVRDWQQRSATWVLGKSFDTHGPLGPWLVTADEITDPHNLTLTTWVDREQRQHANTGDMLFNCFEMVAYLSQAITLEPGDVITTGTPSGVGVKMTPRGYLKPGQTVRIEISGIGELFNPVIAEA